MAPRGRGKNDNINMTFGIRQNTTTSSLFPSGMIAKLASAQSNAKQSKSPTPNPHKQWEQQKIESVGDETDLQLEV